MAPKSLLLRTAVATSAQSPATTRKMRAGRLVSAVVLALVITKAVTLNASENRVFSVFGAVIFLGALASVVIDRSPRYAVNTNR
jgi:hypothetical protein